MRSRADRGARAEREAGRYLRRAGYQIIDRNWRCRGGELDIVLARGDLIVFVEVRSVFTSYLGTPTQTVSPPKQARVAYAAGAWLCAHRRPLGRIRFDVVGVICRRRRWAIEHIEDAFCPAWAY